MLCKRKNEDPKRSSQRWVFVSCNLDHWIVVWANILYQAAQQSLRLEQVAQLHGIPIERLTTSNDSQQRVSQVSDTQLEAMQSTLRALQAERLAKQKEMNVLEKEVRREKSAM